MEIKNNGLPRVVVTGMGALTPLGTLNDFWQGLIAGKSGIRKITNFDPQDLEVKIAGEVDFEPRDYIDPKSARRMARGSQIALIAAQMSLDNAGLSQETVAAEGDRVGVAIGAANAGFGKLVEISYQYTYDGRKPFPTALINGLPNMPGHYDSLEMEQQVP